MRGRITALALLAGTSFAGTGAAGETAGGGAAKHAAIGSYEGTKTCAACHAKQVEDMVASLHYQHQGPTPFLANAQQGNSAGMMVSY
jgi:hypothetical protein